MVYGCCLFLTSFGMVRSTATYAYIVDPISNQRCAVQSERGKEILSRHLEHLQQMSAGAPRSQRSPRRRRHSQRQRKQRNRKSRGGIACGASRPSASSTCFPDLDTQQYKNPCPVLPLDGPQHDRYSAAVTRGAQGHSVAAKSCTSATGGRRQRRRTSLPQSRRRRRN